MSPDGSAQLVPNVSRNKKRKRWAVLGLGRAGQAHVRQLHTLQDIVQVVAACDSNRNIRAAGDVRLYEGWDELLEDTGVLGLDGISVCLPIEYHGPPTCIALSKGLAVLCEKPLALSHNALIQIAFAATVNQRLFMVSQLLFEPWFRFLECNLERTSLGPVERLVADVGLRRHVGPQYLAEHYLVHYIGLADYLFDRLGAFQYRARSLHNVNVEAGGRGAVQCEIRIQCCCPESYQRLSVFWGHNLVRIQNGYIVDAPKHLRRQANHHNTLYTSRVSETPIATHFGPGLRSQYEQVLRGAPSQKLDWRRTIRVSMHIAQLLKYR